MCAAEGERGGRSARQVIAAGAALRVAGIEAGVVEALRMLAPGERTERSNAALAFAAEHRGAARRMAGAIDTLLKGRLPA